MVSYITIRHLDSRRKLTEIILKEVSQEKRKYIEDLEQLIETMNKQQVNLPFYFRVTYNYFNVYENNVDKIGLLMAPLPELIAKFYTQCFSVLEDIKLFEKMNFEEITFEQLIEHYKELLSSSFALP